jgi:rubrerythrin
MQQQIIEDRLSEFLMVEQCGLQLYTVVAERCKTPKLAAKYREFGRETAHHREVLVKLITELGGDPDYVSPTARVVQYKASKLLDSALVVDGLSREEIECGDLENVLLAETKDHADWHVLSQLAERASGDVQRALQAAVDEVEAQEDEHLEWARETLSQLTLKMAAQGKAPSPERWQARMTGPEPGIEAFHAAPYSEGLLEGAHEPMWIETPISRSLATSNSSPARSSARRKR